MTLGNKICYFVKLEHYSTEAFPYKWLKKQINDCSWIIIRVIVYFLSPLQRYIHHMVELSSCAGSTYQPKSEQ